MATMIRLPVDNAIINSYTTFLDKYNPQEAHNINSIKQFIQTDENIAPGGLMAQNEELLTRAQINYAVVKKTPPADSIRQFGILYEWLDTRATESTGRAKALITTMGELKHVMTNNTPESALVALVDLYMKMEQLYTGSAMRIWSIEQFVKFAGLPRNKSYLNT
ncbi:hypothetical protein BDF22DRAFT_657949 [Syncephalis plumigaleata]|nr:hypothetical protein BDF22DRAFT_657949 [Syncephalis plumigaleata]